MIIQHLVAKLGQGDFHAAYKESLSNEDYECFTGLEVQISKELKQRIKNE